MTYLASTRNHGINCIEDGDVFWGARYHRWQRFGDTGCTKVDLCFIRNCRAKLFSMHASWPSVKNKVESTNSGLQTNRRPCVSNMEKCTLVLGHVYCWSQGRRTTMILCARSVWCHRQMVWKSSHRLDLHMRGTCLRLTIKIIRHNNKHKYNNKKKGTMTWRPMTQWIWFNLMG